MKGSGFVRYLPNLLSCLRMLLSLLLFFLPGKPVLFSGVYLLCGGTDVADGCLARRFQGKTALGARLDSLGDGFFFLVVLYFLFFHMGLLACTPVVAFASLTLFVKLLNLVITKRKFKLWSSIHTIASKAAGLLLFAAPVPSVLLGFVPWQLSGLLCGLCLFAALEETVLLLTFKKYNANHKGFYFSS